MHLSLLAILLCAPPATAQIVGGDWPTHYQFDGPMAESHFGVSVSNAGDVNNDGFDDLVIGAPYTPIGGLLNGGIAIVHSGADGSILYQFNAAALGENLGYSVSNAGDVNNDGFDDIIVGAPFRYGAVAWSGSASVYSGADGSTLHLFDGAVDFDNHGFSVSNAGDVNADGFADLFVGAPGAGPGGIYRAGSAFVYSGANGTTLFQFDGSTPDSRFGFSVSNAGDVNADGFDDLIVGDMFADPGALANAGSAFVYSGANGAILYQFDGATADDEFGTSVANAGDVDGDGFDDLIVGAGNATPGGIYGAGSAFVYSGANGATLFQFDGLGVGDGLGQAVSIAGDINVDGFTDLIVGGTNSAFLFSGEDGSILQRFNGPLGEHFGTSVSNTGDIHGDGRANVIVGASRTAPGGVSNAGSVFVFGFDPFLTANSKTISATSGGTINLTLGFPSSAAFDDYKVLLSATGTGPTTYGVDIPLTQDSLVIDTFFGNYPVPNHTNMHGTLDASGDATASLTIPAGIPPGLIGRTYYFAAIANQPGQLPEYSSVAVAIEVVL
jgi:hypothetical protein